jgi:Holliday junction resolvase RusA-like endonuclease
MTRQVIYGQVPSKSNSYRAISVNGINKLVKTNKVRKYERSFLLQCNQYRNVEISNYFEFYADIFFQSWRSDLDGCTKVILDCLQKAKAIKNDNKCVKIYLRKFIDKNQPRVEFILKEIKQLNENQNN